MQTLLPSVPKPMMVATHKLTVYLVDNTELVLHVTQDVKTESLLTQCLRKIGLLESSIRILHHCFALCESLDEGETLSSPLSSYDYVMDSIASWRVRERSPGSARLFLVLRLVTPGVLGACQVDGAFAHALFLKCCRSVMNGTLLLTPDTAVLLAGLQLFVRMGPYDPARVFYLPSLYEGTIPDTLLPQRAPEVWNGLIASAFARLGNLGAVPGPEATRVAKELYCATLEENDLFGYHLFPATQKFSRALPPSVLLGLSAEGVLVLGEDKTTLQRISLASVELWTGMNDGGVGEEAKGVPLATLSSIAGFFQITLKAQTAGKASLFGFATGGTAGQIYQFGCREGGTAAALMRAFTEQLLRELMEEEKDGAAAAAATAAAAAAAAAAVAATAAAAAAEAAGLAVEVPEAATGAGEGVGGAGVSEVAVKASTSSPSGGGEGGVPGTAPQVTPSQ